MSRATASDALSGRNTAPAEPIVTSRSSRGVDETRAARTQPPEPGADRSVPPASAGFLMSEG
ncbi:hypothetical protein PSA01_29560 [Pseudonocardia saturnea]|uniref:Uncharacterized protein n=1 Tax=Pseudonocardia saturnea TaxID=33909 RepID=A0ABQ0RZ31_9PSEU|nr:hypothetical protein Pdca_39490 [Pseudonocardia autotrophica]GEC25927.1 hypothetical protein PSA01_29560 [Pseudonocardia saturnea]